VFNTFTDTQNRSLLHVILMVSHYPVLLTRRVHGNHDYFRIVPKTAEAS